jgi:hypothetical protein
VSLQQVSAVPAAATSATASMQTKGLMPPLPGYCCPVFRQITKYLFARLLKKFCKFEYLDI